MESEMAQVEIKSTSGATLYVAEVESEAQTA